jgi:OOP family OmpA-OmpF porin
MRQLTLIAAGVAACVIAGEATAQAGRAPAAQAYKPFYVGGGAGWSRLVLDKADFPSGSDATFAADPAQQPLTDSRDESSTGWKVFAGWRFHPLLGVEAGYSDLGSATVQYSNAFGTADAKLKNKAWTVALVPQFHFGQGFSLFGKLGAAFNRTETSVSATLGGVPVSNNGRSNRTKFLWGVGGGYDFTPQFGVRMEYESYGNVGEQDGSGRAEASLVSGSAIVRF